MIMMQDMQKHVPPAAPSHSLGMKVVLA